MKLLNIGAGNERYPEPFINLDNLRTQLREGTPERAQLDDEPNYVEHDIAAGPLPFDDGSFDGVLMSHVVEHFDAQAGAKLMQNALHILKSGGVLFVSVPDAAYFRRVYAEDCNENWPRLFGQLDPANPIPTFFEAALWFDQHRALLTEDALWCYFVRAGFNRGYIVRVNPTKTAPHIALDLMRLVLNRPKFSLAMAGFKL